ncbi:MAG: aldose epimerase family protein [Pseudomonadota bacterium]
MGESDTGVTAQRDSFGTLPDGRDVARVTLTNRGGITATTIAWGAGLQALAMPDHAGDVADVCAGYDDLSGVLGDPWFMGASVGRVANRIAGGRFAIDGAAYVVPPNDGAHALHGGAAGFDRTLWDVVSVGAGSVTFRLVSPAGDMGFPGTLTVTATYSLDADDRLTIDYRATTDAATIVNLSHHAYWNLAGGGTALDHELTVLADRYTPTDATAIPTGVLAPVAGTPFDFRTPTPIGARIRDARDPQIGFGRGYDHNWIVGDAVTQEPRPVARLVDRASGRGFELRSNQPGLQVYSGNYLDGSRIGKGGQLLRQGDAVALEPQGFPDAANQPAFPSIRLDPGAAYRNVIVYAFGVSD